MLWLVAVRLSVASVLLSASAATCAKLTGFQDTVREAKADAAAGRGCISGSKLSEHKRKSEACLLLCMPECSSHLVRVAMLDLLVSLKRYCLRTPCAMLHMRITAGGT